MPEFNPKIGISGPVFSIRVFILNKLIKKNKPLSHQKILLNSYSLQKRFQFESEIWQLMI
ncbi:hypothetical protein BpHYR1_013315 [Brachionus plicatilis]|uniref:Uncharacterized protein n=1 Tax=Brachionus plicatilis TaxID=10195 RepID=A0A3M7QTP1_BRAPC|nr:hypothetical protein BpHYR1_013315 [Brachionus plicatilis]